MHLVVELRGDTCALLVLFVLPEKCLELNQQTLPMLFNRVWFKLGHGFGPPQSVHCCVNFVVDAHLTELGVSVNTGFWHRLI